MKVEEMALRSEIRNMLNEAGYNRNTLKVLVKDVLQEELNRAITQSINESDFDGYVKRNIDSIIKKTTRTVLEEKITAQIVNRYFNSMKVSVEIKGFDEM